MIYKKLIQAITALYGYHLQRIYIIWFLLKQHINKI